MGLVALVSFAAGELKEHYLHHTPPAAVGQMQMPPTRYEDPEELMIASTPPIVPLPKLKIDDKSCERLIRAQYEIDGRVTVRHVGKAAASSPALVYAYDVIRSRPAGPNLDVRVHCIIFERGNSIRIQEIAKNS